MPILFPLNVRGKGTIDIESMNSYVHRLSIAHTVSIERLIKDVKEIYLSDKNKDGGFTKSISYLPYYTRPTNGTQNIISAFEYVTGKDDLSSLTFLSTHRTLERCIKIYSKNMRWCPACMNEFSKNGEAGYYKLIWEIKGLKHCPIHRVRLQKYCHHCGWHQNRMGVRKESILCQKCGKFLGRKIYKRDIVNRWNVNADDLLGMVKFISINPNVRFSRDLLMKSINFFHDYSANFKIRSKSDYRLFKEELPGIIHLHQSISLTTVRRLAARFGIDLTDFLLGDFGSGLLSNDWFENLPKDIGVRKRKKNLDKSINYQLILQCLKENEGFPPASLKDIAEKVGISKGYFHYHFKSLAKDVTDNHRQWKNDQQTKKKLKARSLVLDYFTDKNDPNKNISRKHAFRKIREETGLPKDVIRDAINSVYRILF